MTDIKPEDLFEGARVRLRNGRVDTLLLNPYVWRSQEGSWTLNGSFHAFSGISGSDIVEVLNPEDNPNKGLNVVADKPNVDAEKSGTLYFADGRRMRLFGEVSVFGLDSSVISVRDGHKTVHICREHFASVEVDNGKLAD